MHTGYKQPHPRAAAQIPAGADDHPDGERRNDRRPHPSGLVAGRRNGEDEGASERHERGGHERPPLRLVGPPLGEHGQHRPGRGEGEQHRAGDDVLLRPGERAGDERDGPDELPR